jgi:uncharacterized Fe-S cluster-containing radical SAM superfamily enzyme
MLRRHHRRQLPRPALPRAFIFGNRVMDLVSAAYNKLEGLAVAADRVLNAAVACCETWLAGRRLGEGPDRAAASHKNRRLSP